MEIDELETPVGRLQITVNENYIRKIVFTDQPNGARSSHPILLKVRGQLRAYFEGERKTFDLPLQPGGTEFQQRVWKVLSNIPYGTTITYQELAEKLGIQIVCAPRVGPMVKIHYLLSSPATGS